MRYEKSCGAVIWTVSGNSRLYLIEHMKNGHYFFCKGHVEPGETEEQTALREIWEETGLNVELNTAFREELSYSPFPGCVKDVVFFIARSSSMNATLQPEEVKAIHWLPFPEAMEILTHKNAKAVLQKAEQFLNDKTAPV